MTRPELALLGGVLLIGGLGVACDRTDTAPAQHIVIATAAEHSVYDRLGLALATAAHARWGVEAEVRRSTGSVDNIGLVAAGEADVAFTTVDVAEAAAHGDAPFHAATPVAALAGLYDEYLHVVVRAESTINRLADLAGLRVSIGPEGSGTEMVAARALQTVGLTLSGLDRRQLETIDAAAALQAGEIDAFFVTGGLPTPVVAELARRLPVRLLSMPDEIRELQRSHGELYLPRSIPASTYGLDDEVETIGVRNLLVVRQDMPDPVARWLTDLLFASRTELAAAHEQARWLDRRAATATYPLPLHPGAAASYLEAKPLALGQQLPCVGGATEPKTP